MRKSMTKLFCECIKKVRKSVKANKKRGTRTQAAIAICTKSVLQSRGRTLKRFTCKNTPNLVTQAPINR